MAYAIFMKEKTINFPWLANDFVCTKNEQSQNTLLYRFIVYVPTTCVFNSILRGFHLLWSCSFRQKRKTLSISVVEYGRAFVKIKVFERGFTIFNKICKWLNANFNRQSEGKLFGFEIFGESKEEKSCIN